MAMIHVTTAQRDTVVAVQVGDTVELRLPDNPSTGYRWALDEPPGDSMTVDDEGFEAASSAVGSGGASWWRLQAGKPGRVVLQAKRWRPWEGERSVLERFSATIDIAPAR